METTMPYEGLDVLVSHLSQDLAVELDAGNLQAVHELRVRDVVQTSSSVDTSDPCLLYTSRCV